jgi:hypothetical protein
VPPRLSFPQDTASTRWVAPIGGANNTRPGGGSFPCFFGRRLAIFDLARRDIDDVLGELVGVPGRVGCFSATYVAPLFRLLTLLWIRCANISPRISFCRRSVRSGIFERPFILPIDFFCVFPLLFLCFLERIEIIIS